MLSSKTDRYGRRIQDRGNPTLSQDAVKLLKTQDAGYLKTMIQQTRRTREKLQQHYLLDDENVSTLADGAGRGKSQHVVFAGSREEQQVLGQQRGKRRHLSTGIDSPHQPVSENDVPTARDEIPNIHMDPRQVALRKAGELRALRQERVVRKLRKRQREGQQSRLKALELREKDLLAAEQQLDHGRARMSNSIGGVNKAGVRWKIRERKR